MTTMMTYGVELVWKLPKQKETFKTNQKKWEF